METRKVQMVGGGTYTVSLPKSWAESEGITTGDVVHLRSHVDGVLVIQARDREPDALDRVAIPVTGDSTDRIERVLRAAYAAGFEEIALEAGMTFTDAQHRTVERVAAALSGVAVVEETPERLTVRTLLETGEVSVRQTVRQLRFLALSMHEDATAALGGEAPAIAGRDDQVDRLASLVHRHLVRGLSRLDEVDALGLPRPELFALWATSRELERVADHAESVAALAVDFEPASPPAHLREFAGAAREVVEDAVSVTVGDADADAAFRALTARDQLREEADRLDRRLTGTVDPRHVRILDRLRRTVEHGGNVAEVGLRAAVRRGDLPVSADRGAE